MAREGVRHLIECHCVLPQFKNTTPTVYHKFVVFSIIEDDVVQKKLAQCNNCGIIHKVTDFCKSEIVHGAEESSSIRQIDDVKLGLPGRLVDFLVQQSLDISTWEWIEYLLDHKLEYEVVIKKDQKGDLTNLKILHLKEDGSFKVKNETRQDEVTLA
jgi:hypothetical protein